MKKFLAIALSSLHLVCLSNVSAEECNHEAAADSKD
jgi:hypothetical protein